MIDDEATVSWVGGIYRKLEALCLEADDLVRQEAHEFIENHLQPVGSNVKQFYSELVRDMLPPQSMPDGSTEIEQHDLVLKETSDSFTNVSFEVSDEKKQLEEQRYQGKSEVTQTVDILVNGESNPTSEDNERSDDDMYTPATSDDVSESISSLDVQSLVSVELGNSNEDEALNVDHVQGNGPCEQITAGNSNLSSISGNPAKLDESCILVNNDDEEYVLSLREKRRWCYKKNWKQKVLALASKSLKQKQSQSLCPSAVASVETREHEEPAFSLSIADKENCDSDWEIV